MNENRNFNEEEFLKKVESAAKTGAVKGSRRGDIISSVTFALVLLLSFAFVSSSMNNKVSSFFTKTKEMFSFDNKLDQRDLALEDDSFFGYTAADFEDAILNDGTALKKLEVYSAEISDAATLTDTGFVNLKIFTKTQVITFFGTAVYTVDLSKLNKNNIVFDGENKTVTLKIPHAVMEEINIPMDKIQVSDAEKGWLAFGEIKLTVEDTARVEAQAREKMEQRLAELSVQDTADRFAKLSVWEIYQPLVSKVSPEYKLVVDFT